MPFGQCIGVRVIDQIRRSAGEVRDQPCDGNPIPSGQVGRREHLPASGVEGTAASNADCNQITRKTTAQMFPDPFEYFVWPGGWELRQSLESTFWPPPADRNLGATDIDAQITA